MPFLREKSTLPRRAWVVSWHSGLAGLKARFFGAFGAMHLPRGNVDFWGKSEGGNVPREDDRRQ
jgi:hypothetical protein